MLLGEGAGGIENVRLVGWFGELEAAPVSEVKLAGKEELSARRLMAGALGAD